MMRRYSQNRNICLLYCRSWNNITLMADREFNRKFFCNFLGTLLPIWLITGSVAAAEISNSPAMVTIPGKHVTKFVTNYQNWKNVFEVLIDPWKSTADYTHGLRISSSSAEQFRLKVGIAWQNERILPNSDFNFRGPIHFSFESSTGQQELFNITSQTEQQLFTSTQIGFLEKRTSRSITATIESQPELNLDYYAGIVAFGARLIGRSRISYIRGSSDETTKIADVGSTNVFRLPDQLEEISWNGRIESEVRFNCRGD